MPSQIPVPPPAAAAMAVAVTIGASGRSAVSAPPRLRSPAASWPLSVRPSLLRLQSLPLLPRLPSRRSPTWRAAPAVAAPPPPADQFGRAGSFTTSSP